MPVTLAVALRACCLAVALLLASARAAEQPSPLIGATKSHVISVYGEPRSQMESGGRVFFFYPREKIVFQGNSVVEVEKYAEAPSGPPSIGVEPGTATPPSTSSAGPTTGTPAPSTTPTTEPKVEIKSVRGPGAKDSLPPPSSTSTPIPETTPPRVTPTPEGVPKTATKDTAPEPTKKRPASSSPTVVTPTAEEIAARKAAERAAILEKEKKLKAEKEARRRLDSATEFEATDGIFNRRNLLIAAAVLAAVVAFMFWRSRSVSVVTTSPTPTPRVDRPVAAAAKAGTAFTPEILGKLDGGRFEELVAAYYSKTGVVAERTNAGATDPVHIKISWKGEPRPFAYVQCIAHPSGEVAPSSVQSLVGVLAKDGIRRGYVVTPGAFNAAARDVASEKHITLMPGDVFLEKLNALPAAARVEIMQAIGEKT